MTVGTDRTFGWKMEKLFVPIRQFTGWDNNGTDDISLSQGTPVMGPASGTLEVAALPMTTADEIHSIMQLPATWNRQRPLAARVWFIHASTDAADAPVFKLGVLFYGKQAQTIEAQANADLVTTITHDGTSATDNSLEVTPWTKLNWDAYVATTDVMAAISLELDALGSASADECEILGVEFAWERYETQEAIWSVEKLIADNSLN